MKQQTLSLAIVTAKDGNRKRQNQMNDPALRRRSFSGVNYFFFLRSLEPTRPTKPVPKRSIVAGSGTGFVLLRLILSK